MKPKKNAGKHQTGKAGTSRRRHLPRPSAISGLALTALLLSAGISEQASALTFTFEYTYTITANTCKIYFETKNDKTPITGSSAQLEIDWGKVTKAQLSNSEKKNITKTFGLKMVCDGDIYNPTLQVTPGMSSSSSASGTDILYVSDKADSVAGFAVKVSDNAGVTSGQPLQGEATLSEVATDNTRIITLDAWPTLMTGKNADSLKPGDPIKGSVTINVSYN